MPSTGDYPSGNWRWEAIARIEGREAVCGLPKQNTEEVGERFVRTAAEGFNLMSVILPNGLNNVCRLRAAEVPRRGLFRPDYRGFILRDLWI